MNHPKPNTDRSSQLSRRFMLRGVAGLGIAGLTTGTSVQAAQDGMGLVNKNAQDEAFWRNVAADFDVAPDVTNLENGYWGIMSRPVLENYIANTRKVNRENSHYARRGYKADHKEVRSQVAQILGAKPDEIVVTRGATEALQGLIGGYNKLLPGQAVMYADLDYYSMKTAMDRLAVDRACDVVRLSIPEPTDYQSLLDFYQNALDANPKVKLLLLTQIGHRTGLQIPVKEVTQMARKAGVDVIVDAAHSVGQMDIDIEDIGADFIGFNLHKWIGAPIGVGVMYIREDRLEDIRPNLSSEGDELLHTEGRIHTGTVNFAAMMSIPAALAYRRQVGAGRIEARLRYLRQIWVDEVSDLDAVQVLTPPDDRLHAGITSFRLGGKTSAKDNKAIAEQLLQEHGIFTVYRGGVAQGDCVRVTPAIYNNADQVHQLAVALRKMAKHL